MKKMWKKILGITLTMVLCVGLLAGCGSSSSSSDDADADETASSDTETVTTETHKIVVYTLKASGSIVESVEAFLDSICDELNFTYEVRFAGDDAATLLSNVEAAIAEGFEGIISMTDKGNNAAILELCEENGVYFGGTWSNQSSSLNSSDAGYDILMSEYYVGAIADGRDDYEYEIEEYAAAIAAKYEELDDDEKEGSIGITTNPSKWTPGQQIAAENLYQVLTTEYGIPESAFATETLEKRTEDETYSGTTLEAGTWSWCQVDTSSMALPTSYFQSNPNLKLIASFASITYIEPALQTADLHGEVYVWTCGYESEDYLLYNFGSDGDMTYQGFRTAPIEDVAYPLVQILDALNGYSYSDKDETVSELVAAIEDGDTSAKYTLKSYLIPYSSSIIIVNDEQFEAFSTGYVYGTADGADSIVTAEDLMNLMVTYNPDATYADLVAFFDETGSLTADALTD